MTAEFVKTDPQLVLMDIRLPFFNGYHWCTEIRRIWVHQIKTPIAAMQLVLQMQRNAIEEMEWEDEHTYQERLQMVSDLEEELFQVEQYVSMALQYQRVNDGSDYVIEELALDRIVREVIRKYAKVMIRKKLTVSYSGTERKVITDEKWLAFVIEQLLSNAVKYSTQGTVQVDVVDETNWSYLRIRDQGIGIQKEDIMGMQISGRPESDCICAGRC